MRFLKLLAKDVRGASAAEYALMLAIIGAAIALAAFALGVSISGSMDRAAASIRDCGGGC